MEKSVVIKKGVRSRQWIVEQSALVFNTFGIDITLNQLSDHLEISRGRISHFFATRDELFVAISEAYQSKLKEIRTVFLTEKPEYTLADLELFFGQIMDNQYSYRCAILYVSGHGNSKKEMNQHISESYREHKVSIRFLTEYLVKSQSLKQDILDESNYPIFEFQFVNLFTSWVISKEIYYPDKSYLEMKPLYLKGLFRLFDPYLVKECCSHIKE
jgi:AcrR family transcriptional regulator